MEFQWNLKSQWRPTNDLVPPDYPEPQTPKARAIWRYLDQHPGATIPELLASCGVKDQHTVIRHRRSWRETREREAIARTRVSEGNGVTA